jgi:uncharacterized protein (DUF2141 family)
MRSTHARFRARPRIERLAVAHCRWLLVACLLHVVGGRPASAETTPGTLTVNIVNLRVEEGFELCLLYSSADGFPYDSSKAVQHTRVPIHDGEARCTFLGVKPGVYAIAVMRDENGDGVPTTDEFDLPKHGIGASNNARAFMGPPKFDDAKFLYNGGSVPIAIRMTYGSLKG